MAATYDEITCLIAAFILFLSIIIIWIQFKNHREEEMANYESKIHLLFVVSIMMSEVIKASHLEQIPQYHNLLIPPFFSSTGTKRIHQLQEQMQNLQNRQKETDRICADLCWSDHHFNNSRMPSYTEDPPPPYET